MEENTYEQLKLENQVCFPLYAASRLVVRLYQPLLKELDITYPQYLVLMVLWEKDGLTVNEIGEKLILNTNTITPLLKRLVQQEIIIKKRSTVDERRVEVFLTEKGKEMKHDACQIPSALYKQLGYPADKALALKKALDELIQHLK